MVSPAPGQKIFLFTWTDDRSPFTYEGNVVASIYFDTKPVRMCIEHHGICCKVCGFDFYDAYGDLGKDYIHVHHLIPIYSIRKKYTLVPEKDLIPVCPNCHAMIHKKTPALSIEQLREIIWKRAILNDKI